jgi:hypothetical protein
MRKRKDPDHTSGSKSWRPKNMRILRIRIPNTACGTSGSKDEGEGPEEAGIDGRGEERGRDGHSHQAASVTTQHRQSHT